MANSWIKSEEKTQKLPTMVGTIRTGEKKETMLLFGKTGVGKTMAACSLIDNMIRKRPDTIFYYISTDNGFDETFNFYFRERAQDVLKNNVRLYRTNEYRLSPDPLFTKLANMMFSIREAAQPHDWIIIDIADKFWVWAQHAWTEQSAPNNDVATYILDAAKNIKQYMEIGRSQWNWTKRMDNIMTFDVVEAPPCNVMFLMAEKDLEIEDLVKGEEKKTEDADIFKYVGCIPGGQKTLPYNFSTIVYVKGMMNKKFVVLKDRGFMLDYLDKGYDKEWADAFLAQRKKA